MCYQTTNRTTSRFDSFDPSRCRAGGNSHRLLRENVRRHLYPQTGKLTPIPRVVGAGSDSDADVQVTKHITIPTYIDYMEDEQQDYLLMSYIAGETLTTALANASELQRLALIRSFGRFLRQLHTSEIISTHSSQDWLDKQLLQADHYIETGMDKWFARVASRVIHQAAGTCSGDVDTRGLYDG